MYINVLCTTTPPSPTPGSKLCPSSSPNRNRWAKATKFGAAMPERLSLTKGVMAATAWHVLCQKRWILGSIHKTNQAKSIIYEQSYVLDKFMNNMPHN